jgi:hypothetical protein
MHFPGLLLVMSACNIFSVDALPTQVSGIASRKRDQIHTDLVELMTTLEETDAVKDLDKIVGRIRARATFTCAIYEQRLGDAGATAFKISFSI